MLLGVPVYIKFLNFGILEERTIPSAVQVHFYEEKSLI